MEKTAELLTISELQAELGIPYKHAWELAHSGKLGTVTREGRRTVLVERRAVEHYRAWQQAADVIDGALLHAMKLAPRSRGMLPAPPAGLQPDDLPRAVTAWGLACVSAAATFPAQRLLRELEADAAEAADRGEDERAAWLEAVRARLAVLRFEAGLSGELRPILPAAPEAVTP